MGESSRQLGKYEILRRLREEALGTVYLAFDPIYQRSVSLKLYREDERHPGHSRERFQQEGRLMARLQHPSIPKVYELAQTETGDPFMVSEFVRAKDLKTIMSQYELALKERLGIIAAICVGLHYLHGSGIVHRNIKPSNVLLTEDRQVKITGFALASLSFGSNERGLAGTPGYMSPEQVRGQGLDPRADLFSLGVVLYSLLTKKKPFSGPDVQTIVSKVMKAAPPPLAPDWPEVREFQRLLDRALAKKPQYRFASAAAMEKAVRSVIRRTVDRLPADVIFETFES